MLTCFYNSHVLRTVTSSPSTGCEYAVYKPPGLSTVRPVCYTTCQALQAFAHVHGLMLLSHQHPIFATQASNTNVTETDFILQQMINATCACDGVFTNSSNVDTWGTSVYLALNNTADYFLPPSLVNIPDVPAYKSIYCGPLGAGEALVLSDTGFTARWGQWEL
jgi:hypothetical protein